MTKKLVNIKKPVKVTIVFDDGAEQSFDQAVGIFANENNIGLVVQNHENMM